ncbi:MAG: c-type cytochrome [Verrucomicrobia bacterium]|nr:c-type cytochrome [Verrucomicrobiota bacterium]
MKFPLPLTLLVAGVAAVASSAARAADADGPWWAYGFFGPPAPGEKAKPPVPSVIGLRPGENEVEATRPRRVDGSARTFSLIGIRNRMDVVDWFPDEHPPMPRIIKHGSPSLGDKAYGCALCHMPHGRGRPENAPVSGLPPAYFIRQMQDFRSGLRSSSEPRKANALLMVALAQAMTDEEIREAAEYYAQVPATPWVRVVETDMVPQVKPTGARLFLPIEDAPKEPIGMRIIEVPENVEQFEMANPHANLLAYVPVGSIKKGEVLVTTGGATVVNGETVPGKTIACTICHGPDLKGMGEFPPIAGRSPSYLVRQMNDMKNGTRKSPYSLTMLPAVVNLTNEDFVNIAAYVSSRPGGN